uniref:Fatty acid desaturase domain-containing protein n=2 Tax=Panagrolaimus sp. JU765 TaxID=591449 RepID=A0AC34RIW1_9BILA
MATITQTITPITIEDLTKDQFLSQDFEITKKLNEEAKKTNFKPQYVWRNIILFTALHVGALIGFYQFLFVAKWQTVLWSIFGWAFSGLGITAGAHRLWSHKSYKARLPLRIMLMLADSMAFQNDVIEWSRDHRCHHKWTDTDADPHNVNRGFFFSHVGWLLQKKHPKITEMGKKLDLSDLFADPVLAFQRKYYLPISVIMCFLFPTAFAVYAWGEAPIVAFYVAGVFRYAWTLNATWCINSVSHMFGYKPYDVNISPVESTWTTITALGEGGHNYHHTFPQDYRTSEMPLMMNLTKGFIDVCALIGLAYDRKSVADEVIRRQKAKQVEILKAQKAQ